MATATAPFKKSKYLIMIGDLTHTEINDLLKGQILGRLGCQANGEVYIVPITYAYDGNYIYAHSREGLKINIMRKNPNVCFEVDDVNDLANWKSVILHGKYEELLGDRARKVMQLFMSQLEPHLLSTTSIPSHGIKDFHRKEQSEIKSVIFRIEILKRSGKFERQSIH